jgi:alkylation response protein AidB-like acyl-CoA dehydrogenase
MAPALTMLATEVLPGLLPCGPGGHAVVSEELAATAGKAWVDGVIAERTDETTLATAGLPGGTVLMLRHGGGGGGRRSAGWALGLVWLRLGLSDGLREQCVRYLSKRTAGNTALLQQQLVKGAVADALAEQLEVRAVLTGVADDLPDGRIEQLHAQITRADRGLVRLLGASGYLTGGAGQVADTSELLAEAYLRPEEQR